MLDMLGAGFAAFVELCCGPLYILAKVQLADAVVAVAEGAATIAKGTLTLLLLKKSSVPIPIALSWAQVMTAQTSCSSCIAKGSVKDV